MGCTGETLNHKISARYWSASTCFTRWTFAAPGRHPRSHLCAATRADLFQAALSAGAKINEPARHRGGRMLSSVLPVHHHQTS